LKTQALFLSLSLLFIFSCKQENKDEQSLHKSSTTHKENIQKDTLQTTAVDTTRQWVELKSLDSSFVYDIRYATTHNFVHKKMYPCAKCYVRVEVAKALIKIQNQLKKKGLGLKLFDCYRPGKVQQELWNIMPNPSYVANPKTGSMHNRGVAVDVTIIDKNGKELPMGTPYDYFGKKAYHSYTKLPDTVLKNRHLLKTLMSQNNLEPIKSEWWHYSYRLKEYPVEQWVWNCD